MRSCPQHSIDVVGGIHALADDDYGEIVELAFLREPMLGARYHIGVVIDHDRNLQSFFDERRDRHASIRKGGEKMHNASDSVDYAVHDNANPGDLRFRQGTGADGAIDERCHLPRPRLESVYSCQRGGLGKYGVASQIDDLYRRAPVGERIDADYVATGIADS